MRFGAQTRGKQLAASSRPGKQTQRPRWREGSRECLPRFVPQTQPTGRVSVSLECAQDHGNIAATTRQEHGTNKVKNGDTTTKRFIDTWCNIIGRESNSNTLRITHVCSALCNMEEHIKRHCATQRGRGSKQYQDIDSSASSQ